MPNDLRIRAASLTSTVASPATDTQFGNAIRAYCAAQGVDTSGTNQQVLDRFVAFLYADVRRVAREHTRLQKALTKEDAIDAEVDAELGA